jgi:hypothetical protein
MQQTASRSQSTADGCQPGGMDATSHRREVQVIVCRWLGAGAAVVVCCCMSALLLITAASASMWTGLHPDPSQTADGYQPGGMDAATHRRKVQVVGCRCCCRCVLLHVCFVANHRCLCVYVD